MESQEDEEAITARDSKSVVFGIIILLVAIALWVFGPRFHPFDVIGKWFFIALNSLVAITGSVLLVAGLWRYGRAEKTGLRWRDWRGVHFAPWNEVTDFYHVLPKARWDNETPILKYEVQTATGQTCTFNFGAGNSARLAQAIAEQAISARTTILADGRRGWSAIGARPADLPTTFRYDSKQLGHRKRDLIAMGTVGGILTISALAGTFLLVAPFFQNDNEGALFVFARLFMLIGAPLLLVAPLVPFWTTMKRMAREQREIEDRVARGERFVADREGLTFYQDGEPSFVRWETISNYDFGHKTQNKYTGTCCMTPGAIVSEGRVFPVSYLLPDYALFQHILRRYAAQGVEKQIAANENEALGGVSAQWTGGEEGKGERVYHARTRSAAKDLRGFWFAAILLSIGLVSSMENHLLRVLVLPCLLAWPVIVSISYWKYQVRIGEKGISERNLGTEATFSWDEIKEVRTFGNQLFLESHNGKEMKLNIARLARGSEIRSRIDEHRRRRHHQKEQGDIDQSDVNTQRGDWNSEDAVLVQTVGERQ